MTEKALAIAVRRWILLTQEKVSTWIESIQLRLAGFKNRPRNVNKAFKESWVGVPPWIILGAVIILVPIFFFWTTQDIKKQKEGMALLLLEKGAALIRSFEAGTRTGMIGMMGNRAGAFQLQRLLMETAQQPDIAYILVTDGEGKILAHSHPSRIGESYGSGLDLEELSRMEKAQWRRVADPSGKKIFEVFRRFNPIQPFGRGQHSRAPHGLGQLDPGRFGQWEWNRRMVIFVGLDMSTVEEASQREIRQSVVLALVLLLIGFAGIVLLFLAQAYRSTRSSLTRIKAFSENVVESMPIGLLAMDREGRIVSMNHAAEAVLRISSREILGRPSGEVLPRPLWAVVADPGTGKKMVGRELECPLEEGKVVPLDVSISTLEDERGMFLGRIILFRDLTEVQHLKREVETSKRLASLGRLAAGIAHEIRNPLSSIKGFATYFGERYRDVPEDRGTAEIMVKEVDRLNRVISQLLEFARPMSIQKKPSSPQALIEHSLKMIRAQAMEKNIQIESSLPEGIGDVSVDPDKISQVLLNLYLNSIEAMSGKGTLSVDLRRADGRRGIEIVVSDTGTGIRKEDLAQIFDPYFTTRASGTGLGLAIVHNVVEAHKGEIKAESEPGRGTTMTVYLPE